MLCSHPLQARHCLASVSLGFVTRQGQSSVSSARRSPGSQPSDPERRLSVPSHLFTSSARPALSSGQLSTSSFERCRRPMHRSRCPSARAFSHSPAPSPPSPLCGMTPILGGPHAGEPVPTPGPSRPDAFRLSSARSIEPRRDRTNSGPLEGGMRTGGRFTIPR